MLESPLSTALVDTALASPATIGVALARADSVFRTMLLNGMQAEAARHPGVTLQLEDGRNDTSRQPGP